MYIVYEDGKYKAVMNFESLKELLKGRGNYEVFDMNADRPENKFLWREFQ